jgi:UDPglucose 6-dehydrogenase
MKTIGIVGNGFVGGATALLENEHVELFVYDLDPLKCSHHDLGLKDLTCCDFIFVCVPTPMDLDGSANTILVDKIVIELIDYGFNSERIIIKSTVPVGTSKRLGAMFMPEFLTEKNWKKDFLNQADWILGTNDRNESIRDELWSIFKSAHNSNILSNKPRMHFVTTEEAELVKYTRNCFLAVKVSFFNEIHDFCTALDLDYDRVKDMVVLDSRITKSHTQVPGPDGKSGFGGTCFPKDMSALQRQFSKIGISNEGASVLEASIKRNNKIDRPEKDWKNLKGRAVV